MKISKVEGGADERLILIGMVTDPTVLSRVAAEWPRGGHDLNHGLFASKYSNLIGRLCVHYWDRYAKPPGQDIESLFTSWAEAKERDKDLVKTVERCLEYISDEYETAGERSSEYILDTAGKHFKAVSLSKLSEGIRGDVGIGDLESASKRVDSYGAPELGVGAGVDIFHDDDVIRQAFEYQVEPLIEWPGDMGHFLNRSFHRDSFIALMGPEKRGKSWWLQEVAWQGVKQKRKVAFFSIGDMSQNQVILRMSCRIAGRPLRAGTYKYPTSLSKNDAGEIEVEHEEREYSDELTWRVVAKAAERMMRGRNGSYLKISTHPNSSVTVNTLRSILERWARADWVPDIVVIDYADLLEPLDASEETRHQINKNWKYLRRMSQELHCCVVTATQSDSASYDCPVLTKKNFTDDKRKAAHVTGMLGINITGEEKVKGVTRLNWIANREEDWSEYTCLTVAGSLAFARPAVKSLL